MNYKNQLIKIGKKSTELWSDIDNLVSAAASDFDGDFSDDDKFRIRSVRRTIDKISADLKMIEH